MSEGVDFLTIFINIRSIFFLVIIMQSILAKRYAVLFAFSFLLTCVLISSVDSMLKGLSNILPGVLSSNLAASIIVFLIVLISSILLLFVLQAITNSEISFSKQVSEVNCATVHEQVASEMKDKITSLEARSLLIYWTMILVIIIGVVLIIFSGYLASLDSYSSGLWNLVENSNPLDKINNYIYRPSQATQIPSDIAAQISALTNSYIDSKNRLLSAMIDDLKARTDSGHTLNVGGVVLRISILGMLIFLVQILIQLYRYNSRLITFYTSRRDAIMLGGGELKLTKDFSELLLPKGFDFGKEPVHPFSEAAQLLKVRGRVQAAEPPADGIG